VFFLAHREHKILLIHHVVSFAQKGLKTAKMLAVFLQTKPEQTNVDPTGHHVYLR
jgi:hypothetical protein